MNNHDHTPDEPQKPSSNATPEGASDIINDGMFSTKVTEDMTLRNSLRRGLVEAQGKNLDRIPLYVSWPNWLEDGIVCLYAKDLHKVLHDTVQRTALAIRREFNIESMDDTPAPFEVTTIEEQPVPQPHPEQDIPQTAEPYAVGEAEPVEISADDLLEDNAPPPAPKKAAPPSDQDIADQLFEELRKGKRD